jgi:protein ImuB
MAVPTPLWLALHLPALSLESWAASRGPEQADRPLALLHEHQVLHADVLALARGVRPGLKRATALALAPDLLLGAADARRDAQALRAVVDVALGFSPSVTWLPPGLAGAPAANPPLVGVRLEVQSCLRYFGGLPALLERLRSALAPLGHRVRIASAPTALGAALLAGWRDDLAQGPHGGGPDARAALQTLLDTAPLALLASGSAHAAALQGMGLHTLADLRRLPRDGLARRFGTELLADIDRARGHAPEAHAWLTLPPRFASRLELMCRADTSAQLLVGARVLLARLVAWAGARQARIARFTLVMHHEPRRHRGGEAGDPPPTHTDLLIAPAEPAADAEHLYSLLVERLGRLPLAEPALELSLRCEHLVAGTPPNGELFASPASQREGLARLVERLQARLGADRVQRFAPVADHRPECGTRWQTVDPARLGNLGTSGTSGTSAPRHTGATGPAADGAADTAEQARALATQPLWLLPQPRPLAEQQQRPLLAGQPLQLLAGPDRLETGWWDETGPAVRDYFIAQAASGALVWVYRHRLPVAAAGSGWFLQGLFG